MAHTAKRTAFTFLAGAMILLLVLVVYAVYAEKDGERRAKDFCATVNVGDNADAVYKRAMSRGADERQTRWIKSTDGDRWLPVTFTGFTPFSRHQCSVKATEIVTSVEYRYLD